MEGRVVSGHNPPGKPRLIKSANLARNPFPRSAGIGIPESRRPATNLPRSRFVVNRSVVCAFGTPRPPARKSRPVSCTGFFPLLRLPKCIEVALRNRSTDSTQNLLSVCLRVAHSTPDLVLPNESFGVKNDTSFLTQDRMGVRQQSCLAPSDGSSRSVKLVGAFVAVCSRHHP